MQEIWGLLGPRGLCCALGGPALHPTDISGWREVLLAGDTGSQVAKREGHQSRSPCVVTAARSCTEAPPRERVCFVPAETCLICQLQEGQFLL